MKGYYKEVELYVAINDTVSTAFSKDDKALFMGILMEDITDCNVGLAVSNDAGVTWYTVLDPSTGSAAVIVNDGEDPCYVDVSDLLACVPNDWLIRLVFGAQQVAARSDCVLVLRG